MSEPSIKELLLHLVWPVSCPVCGAVGKVLCEECLCDLMSPQLPRCLQCGGNFPCRLHPQKARIRAGSLYDGVIRDIIFKLKYSGYKVLGKLLGRRLAQIYSKPDADVLLPVPLHEKSKRRYNQAEQIAIGMQEIWDMEICCGAEWSRDIPSRLGMNLAERTALRASSFYIYPEAVGRKVCLVDDVCTTGSTLSRLADACEEKGASAVAAFVVAHVPFVGN